METPDYLQAASNSNPKANGITKHGPSIFQTWEKNGFHEEVFAIKVDLLHDDFIDSLPPFLPPNADGLKKWMSETCEAFEHRSLIEEQATDADTSIIKIRMLLKHIVLWRGIPATGIDISLVGYGCFRFRGGKIIEQ